MKNMKKIVALLLATVMVMAMSISVFAANGAITVENATKGQTYTAYKVFDATYNETTKTTSYTVKATDGIYSKLKDENSPFDVSETADSAGRYSVSLKDGKTAQDVIDFLTDNKNSLGTGTEGTFTDGNKVTFDVPYGYYFITSSLGSVVTINTNTPSVVVQDKNTSTPDIPDDGGKHIVDAQGNKITQDDAAIGDDVDFVINFNAKNVKTTTTTDEGGKVVATTKSIENYTITDTPTGLAIDPQTVVVKVNGSEIYKDGSAVDESNKPVTVNIGDDGKLTVNITWAKKTTVDGKEDLTSIYESGDKGVIPVEVTYTAEVKAAAAEGTATNKAVIKYDEDTVTNPNDETKINTYKFNLKKVDDKNTELTGAEFELYDGDTKVELVKVNENEYRIAESADAANTKVTTITVGHAVIKGLDWKTTYTLKEIKAPEGFNLKKDPTTITAVDSETTKAYNDANVINESGAVLPSTGGIGTTMFYVVGSVLVIGAAVVLISKRRMAR